VELHGRRTGPFDRRTVVGMRIKKALSNDDVLIASDGTRLTVGDLIASGAPTGQFNAARSGAYSLVHATYTAVLLGVRGKGFAVPAFQGEIEIRVQSAVLRIAGRYREKLAWKDGRIKLPLEACVHARATGSKVDIWLRDGASASAGLQCLALELFSPEAANELVKGLPSATAPPPALTVAGGRTGHASYLTWVALIGVLVVLALIGIVLAGHRAI
jgi:hypothetical protein